MRDLAVILFLLFGIVMFNSYWTSSHPVVERSPDPYERAKARYEAAKHSGKHPHQHATPTPEAQKDPDGR